MSNEGGEYALEAAPEALDSSTIPTSVRCISLSLWSSRNALSRSLCYALPTIDPKGRTSTRIVPTCVNTFVSSRTNHYDKKRGKPMRDRVRRLRRALAVFSHSMLRAIFAGDSVQDDRAKSCYTIPPGATAPPKWLAAIPALCSCCNNDDEWVQWVSWPAK